MLVVWSWQAEVSKVYVVKLHMSQPVLLFLFLMVLIGRHFKSHNVFLNFKFIPNLGKNKEINLLKMFTVRNPLQIQKLFQVKEIYFISIILKCFDLIFAVYLLRMFDIHPSLSLRISKSLFSLPLLFQKRKKSENYQFNMFNGNTLTPHYSH